MRGGGPGYAPGFYAGIDGPSLAAARAAVPVLLELLDVRSAVDVGCGTGAWLAVLSEHGVGEIAGIDADAVPAEALRIPAACFTRADLRAPLRPARRFDVALSLEVAEHLPASAADAFVASLAALAPVVVFSAAVPGQGGHRHLNERWPSHWAERFRAHGHRPYDVVRPRLWNLPDVAWWYAQNMVVYATVEGAARHPGLRTARPVEPGGMLDVVHPEAWRQLEVRAGRPREVLSRLHRRLRSALALTR